MSCDCPRHTCAIFGFIGMLFICPIVMFNMAWVGLLDIYREKEENGCIISCFLCLFGFFSSLAYYTCFVFVYMIGYFLFVMTLLINDCRKIEYFDCAKSLMEPTLSGFVLGEWILGSND